MNRTAHEHDLSDAELVQRAQRGAQSAVAELVARYQDRVYNTCYRMCQSHADALDLTQSTFVKVLEALPRFRGEAGFYTWVFRIAVNLTLSQRRSQRGRPRISLDQPRGPEGERAVELAVSNGGDVSRAAEQRELHARVEWALAQLESEFRAAVVLKDIEDLDYATIAEILEVPVGTVKSRIHRGRMQLRELLQSESRTLDQSQA